MKFKQHTKEIVENALTLTELKMATSTATPKEVAEAISEEQIKKERQAYKKFREGLEKISISVPVKASNDKVVLSVGVSGSDLFMKFSNPNRGGFFLPISPYSNDNRTEYSMAAIENAMKQMKKEIERLTEEYNKAKVEKLEGDK